MNADWSPASGRAIPLRIRRRFPFFRKTKGNAMEQYKVGYFIGSLERESINHKLAGALIRLAPGNLSFTEISFRDLPPLQLRL
ncbi:hypothetical protein RRH01S_23_00100 [Rhizobium rhizogenes NBRC 13257]|uniref:Uncharacterized protein n=1 Tax=Rhizobium rhizogenes NBRC 13257 TaxID=1220581 RepID=A0AA87U7M7_RHIRH|nr:hypothetical protein RRH01S_23_00100 [Rhizobium rhizogenes NBRC 13257]